MISVELVRVDRLTNSDPLGILKDNLIKNIKRLNIFGDIY